MGTPLAQLDLNNIQGDILEGLPKKGEIFFFFQIDQDRLKEFCTHLLNLTPLIASAADVQNDRERIRVEKEKAAQSHTKPNILDMSGVNIAFSHKGLRALGVRDELNDAPFKLGMIEDAPCLRDDLDKWKDAFMEEIHGVILVTGSSHPLLQSKLAEVLKIFKVGKPGTSIQPVYQVEGHVRPGDQSAHEHFGFADGISQPTIAGFSPPSSDPAFEVIPLGRVLVGQEGDLNDDNIAVERPRWAKDGSFLCFRQLKQRVPEFDNFLQVIANRDGLDKELLGARLVGRWKSGAPVDIASRQDDPGLALDPARNNDFRYDTNSQSRCPFAAHTRKTYPRSDLPNSVSRRIVRRGIQYGPEVTDAEAAGQKSSPSPKLERGLLFVCYQSNLGNGFQFIQKNWANNENFIFNKPVKPGFDPIVGVSPAGVPRDMRGYIPDQEASTLDLGTDVWVVPRGGEYFFSPSISALRDVLAQSA